MTRDKEKRNKRERETYHKNRDKILTQRHVRGNGPAKEYAKKYYQEHGEEMRSSMRKSGLTPHGKYLVYEKGAKKRGILFDLTEEQFLKLWQQPCFYCGADIMTIGVDRVDNSRGYETDNIVPCCAMCNFIKGSRSFDEYLEHCLRVAAHWK